jgi:pimeloyl-ACP methyl ester carboxylesterase
MSEEIITFGKKRTLVGILHKPEGLAPRVDLPAVLLLNAGLLHRVGPNRLYVKIARQLERSGFHVLRFDVWGIGDSQDHAGETKGTFVDDTFEAFEVLNQRLGATKFMLMGICMGAQIALEVASLDPRVESLVLMEGIYVKSARYHVSRILNPRKWKRVFTGESQMVKRLRRKLLKQPGNNSDNRHLATESKGSPTGNGNLTSFLDQNRDKNMKQKLGTLLERGTKIILIFRDGNEIAYNYRLRKAGDEIVAVGLPRGLDVVFVRFADHTFTPLLSQDLLLKAMMRWIETPGSRERARA